MTSSSKKGEETLGYLILLALAVGIAFCSRRGGESDEERATYLRAADSAIATSLQSKYELSDRELILFDSIVHRYRFPIAHEAGVILHARAVDLRLAAAAAALRGTGRGNKVSIAAQHLAYALAPLSANQKAKHEALSNEVEASLRREQAKDEQLRRQAAARERVLEREQAEERRALLTSRDVLTRLGAKCTEGRDEILRIAERSAELWIRLGEPMTADRALRLMDSAISDEAAGIVSCEETSAATMLIWSGSRR